MGPSLQLIAASVNQGQLGQLAKFNGQPEQRRNQGFYPQNPACACVFIDQEGSSAPSVPPAATHSLHVASRHLHPPWAAPAIRTFQAWVWTLVCPASSCNAIWQGFMSLCKINLQPSSFGLGRTSYSSAQHTPSLGCSFHPPSGSAL